MNKEELIAFLKANLSIVTEVDRKYDGEVIFLWVHLKIGNKEISSDCVHLK